ncbi:MAG: DUF58 domain-containing protein [Chitinophagaceae bacterium]
MAFSLNALSGKSKPFVFYIPFTFYLILFAAGTFLLWKYINVAAAMPGNSFSEIITLLLKVILFSIVVLIALCFLTVLVSFIYLVIVKKRGKLVTLFSMSSNNELLANKPFIQIEIHPLLKPAFGFLKFRIRYNEKMYSVKFQPIEKNAFSFFSKKYTASFFWDLPEIKTYQVEKAWIYFEDLFQFFSIAVPLPVNDNFYNPPPTREIPPLTVTPRKTDEENQRVDEIRKMEGEYLNYKHFEGQDDVRRIAWPVYARSRELVVRIPETLDTYASKVYLYATFYTGFKTENMPAVQILFLNYYKTFLWNICRDIQQKGFQMNFIPDLNDQPESENAEKDIREKIAAHTWQNEQTPQAFIKLNNAAAILVSSLCPVDEIRELMYQRNESTLFILIKLSDAIQKAGILHFVSWLFIQQEKNDAEKYRAGWQLSTARFSILDNEKKLVALFNENSKTMIL